MPGKREKMGRQFFQIDRHFSDRLDGVGVKEDTFRAAKLSDFFERINYAGFVVCPHHRDDRGIRSNGALQLREVETALRIDRHDGRGAASPNERFAIVQDGGVFDRGRHHMASLG